MIGQSKVIARANIALAKYWGKSDVKYNLPATPSISITLEGLETETSVRFDTRLTEDRLVLNGKRAGNGETRKVMLLLDRIRKEAKFNAHAEVVSENRFPTAAGLASSASGFAALAAAAAHAAGLNMSEAKLSQLARQSSASAARSIFGGFVELPAGKPGQERLSARPIAPANHWDVRLIVAVTSENKKSVGSTEGMERSRKTSPLYDAWIESAPRLTKQIRNAIRNRDLDQLGIAMEQSTFSFHACAMTSAPGIFYWNPATIAALETVRALRAKNISVWATMDAGPHVKALCSTRDAAQVTRALRKTPGVLRTIVARPGNGVEFVR